MFYLYSLFVLHFIGDFLFQTNYMALNKSKNVFALLLHCFVYSLVFLVFGAKFAIIAGLTHFCVDYVTSKITSKLYSKNDIRGFFVVVGFDQLIHYSSLVYILQLFNYI